MRLHLKKPTRSIAFLLGIAGTAMGQEQAAHLSFSERSSPAATRACDLHRAQTQIDTCVQAAIESKLRWDAYVDASDVDVKVANGIATLVGVVDSVDEKRRAESIARSAFDEIVNADRLHVVNRSPAGQTMSSAVVGASDETVVTVIKEKLNNDARITADHLDVQFSDGVASLRGTVDDVRDKQAVVRLLLSVAGVESVIDRSLVLHSNGVASAQELTLRAHPDQTRSRD